MNPKNTPMPPTKTEAPDTPTPSQAEGVELREQAEAAFLQHMYGQLVDLVWDALPLRGPEMNDARRIADVVRNHVRQALPVYGGVYAQALSTAEREAAELRALVKEAGEVLKEAIEDYTTQVHAHSRDGYCDSIDKAVNVNRWKAVLAALSVRISKRSEGK